MNRIRLLYSCIFVCLCVLVSCREEFDDHYKTSGESTIKENIVDVLRANPDFSLFVKAIDRLNLATTIGRSAIYTCLAQTNQDVETYLKSKGYTSIEEVPEDELAVWLNYHLIMGMYYRYDIELKTNTFSDAEVLSFYRSNTTLKTREDSKHPGKYLRLYTTPWLTGRGEDYRYLHNKTVDVNSFLAEGVSFSDQYDISAANGVIHVLSAPLEPLPRADEAIAADTSLSILNLWLNRYIKYDIKGLDKYGKIDTTKVKSYTFGANIANEGQKYTFIAPTNEAIRNFFGPYLAENFYNEYDSIPNSLVKSILETVIAENYWGMSDITRGNEQPNYFLSIASVYTRKGNEIEPNYVGGLPSSNVMIYKVNKLPTPPLLNSVEGGIHINKSKYDQWRQMVAKGYINGLKDVNLYEHPPRTILIQPDAYWDVYVPDFQKEELDSMTQVLYSSIILNNIKEGEFKNKTYYNTSCGSIFYENGTFTDYQNYTVNLLSDKASWSATNGAIYEIDGFLHPLSAADTMQNLYKMYLEESTDYALFKTACDMSGVAEKLKLAGSFQYTLLIPSDETMIEAGLGDLNFNEEELKEFVQRHIIQRKIFTDGAYSGVINNMNGEILTISGSWEGFTITDESGQSIPIILDKSNRQANNGVLHRITKVLKKKQ